jgi:hypothetical protein
MLRLYPAVTLAVISLILFQGTPALRAAPVTPERIAVLPKEEQSPFAVLKQLKLPKE